jgi:Low iron-inducible periplasmic protein
MTVPLIQNLIHALRLDNRARVKIYAHAVVPLTAGCGPGPFEYLKEKLLDASYQTREVEDIVQRIRSIYPCLSLTCGDIGVHESELANDETKCQDPAEFTSMAGYTPASDVGEFSRLDLDMRQLDILLRMKAYSAADNLYTYGKHVKGVEVGSMSLFHLATSPDRTIVPEFGAFLQYYGKKYDEPESYADQIIRGALQNSDGLWSDAQRRIIVLKAAQVMVMYFGALQYLYNAVSQCQWATGFSDDWDRGAALLIGSLEGTAKNGTHEGYMFYELAQQHCEAFGTCTKGDSIVTINEDLISLLYMGRGAALSNSCSSLQKAANEIARLLLIPIVQGALHTAVQLTESASDSDLLRAEGYVFSRAVLPLVARAKADAAETIDEHLGFPGPKATRRTASAVFAAFADVYQAMGVDCEHIGIIDGNDPCDGAYDDGGASLTIIIACVLLSVCVLYFCFTCLRNRRRHKTRLPENNPRFIAPAPGSDANHSMDINHSMDLLERAFASARVTPNALLSEDMVFDASGKDDDDFDEIQALVESRESDII